MEFIKNQACISCRCQRVTPSLASCRPVVSCQLALPSTTRQYIRLRPRCAIRIHYTTTESNSVAALANTLYILTICCSIAPAPCDPLRENMTSSTKPEVHNVLHCHQTRTEPRSQVTCTENFVKFGHVAFDICELTDRQTNRGEDSKQ